MQCAGDIVLYHNNGTISYLLLQKYEAWKLVTIMHPRSTSCHGNAFKITFKSLLMCLHGGLSV